MLFRQQLKTVAHAVEFLSFVQDRNRVHAGLYLLLAVVAIVFRTDLGRLTGQQQVRATRGAASWGFIRAVRRLVPAVLSGERGCI
jgi:hypothetical protein